LKQLLTYWLGRRNYAEAWELQKRLLARRQQDETGDVLLLCEHPHVITVGRTTGAARNLVAPGDMPVFEIERGGDVTYHGPGQLVGYPILKLEGDERDLHRYLRNLEEAMIRVLARYGISGERNPGFTGVWSGGRKLASIGVAVKRWVTLHGFALNVSTELERFRAINPCGLEAAVMASIQSVAGVSPPLDEVARAMCDDFADVFQRTTATGPIDLLR
jgi:lipoyl(octanoyl) transferase